MTPREVGRLFGRIDWRIVWNGRRECFGSPQIFLLHPFREKFYGVSQYLLKGKKMPEPLGLYRAVSAQWTEGLIMESPYEVSI